MKQREQVGGVDLSGDALVVLQPHQYELLDVLVDLGLPQVVNADPSEAGEVCCDGCGLSGGEHGQQPAGEETTAQGYSCLALLQ